MNLFSHFGGKLHSKVEDEQSFLSRSFISRYYPLEKVFCLYQKDIYTRMFTTTFWKGKIRKINTYQEGSELVDFGVFK